MMDLSKHNLHKLKVCSINTHGILGNLLYVQNLINNYDVIFICEHWLRKNEKYLLNSLTQTHDLFFHSSIDDNYNKGRPYGGLAFFINKSISIDSFEIINNNIVSITLLFNDIKINIFGVYLLFNNNCSFNFTNQECLFNTLYSLILSNSDNNVKNVVIGDFNCDPYRNNRFDNLINKFNHNIDGIILTMTLKSTELHTYSNGYNMSLIDHAIIRKDEFNSDLIKCNILNDVINTSDHKAISLTLFFETNSND
jgi:hypothetical protein